MNLHINFSHLPSIADDYHCVAGVVPVIDLIGMTCGPGIALGGVTYSMRLFRIKLTFINRLNLLRFTIRDQHYL